MKNSYPLRNAYLSHTSEALLKQPISILLTVSNQAEGALNQVGIFSIFDLGSSHLFGAARQIQEATKIQDTRNFQKFSADLIDAVARTYTVSEIANSSIEVLRSLDQPTAVLIQNALGVSTIGELASWPPYHTARAIINDSFGLSNSIIEDEERPDELIPVMRKYATEKVQYDVLVLDKILVPKPIIWIANPSAGLSNPTDALISPGIHAPGVDLLLSGAIDISDIVNATLEAKPALGAVLTYRQSWYPQGLALGHLLHSMALAPGESTRIAMVDWTRAVRASISENTSQAEALFADINRNRSISEVTSAVAKEAQSGFSESESSATQNQNANTSGRATLFSNADVKATINKEEKDGLKFNGNYELGAASSGNSNAKSTTTGWASSKSSSFGDRTLNATMQQNITDRTQQASNSVRNRRATAVTETSQKESETLSTRVVTNYNHMHALTVQYFEVVQIYNVVLELARVTPCLFVPMKLVTFTESVIRRYRNVLATAGLIPSVRALSYFETNHLAIEIPDKVGNWAFLDEINVGFRSVVGFDDSKTIFIPFEKGFVLHWVGVDDAYCADKFTDVVVKLKNGSTREFPLHNDGGRFIDRSLYNPFYYVSLTGQSPNFIPVISIDEISEILLKTSIHTINLPKESEVMLTFNVIGNPNVRSQIPHFRLKGKINVKADETEVSIFKIQKTITDQNIIRHLEENALHYSTAIWRSLDASTITTLLASYSLFGKSLIENIDPVPVSVTGNYIVFRFYGNADTSDWNEFLRKHELDNPRPLEEIIPLPSGGVFAEAVLGRSNAAEKLDITRFWNWQDSPIPILPPEISPLSAGGKANDQTPTTGKLESSLVNIINPPSLPDPAGLAPLYAAIANGNMFRDMSGMAQTAALLQSALQSAQAGAANATDAAGTAQQVAANQLTDILKIAAQIAAAAMGVPTGALGGGSSTTHNLPATPTNKGLNVNAGQKLDEKNLAASNVPSYKKSDAPDANENEWSPYPGGNSDTANVANSNPSGGLFPNETAALNGPLTSGGGLLGMALDTVLGAKPDEGGGAGAAIAGKGLEILAKTVEGEILKLLSAPTIEINGFENGSALLFDVPDSNRYDLVDEEGIVFKFINLGASSLFDGISGNIYVYWQNCKLIDSPENIKVFKPGSKWLKMAQVNCKRQIRIEYDGFSSIGKAISKAEINLSLIPGNHPNMRSPTTFRIDNVSSAILDPLEVMPFIRLTINIEKSVLTTGNLGPFSKVFKIKNQNEQYGLIKTVFIVYDTELGIVVDDISPL